MATANQKAGMARAKFWTADVRYELHGTIEHCIRSMFAALSASSRGAMLSILKKIDTDLLDKGQ